MSEEILIVDDEREIADLVEVYLANDGYSCISFTRLQTRSRAWNRQSWIWPS